MARDRRWYVRIGGSWECHHRPYPKWQNSNLQTQHTGVIRDHAVANVDNRGAGHSEGDAHMFTHQDREDGYGFRRMGCCSAMV